MGFRDQDGGRYGGKTVSLDTGPVLAGTMKQSILPHILTQKILGS